MIMNIEIEIIMHNLLKVILLIHKLSFIYVLIIYLFYRLTIIFLWRVNIFILFFFLLIMKIKCATPLYFGSTLDRQLDNHKNIKQIT